MRPKIEKVRDRLQFSSDGAKEGDVGFETAIASATPERQSAVTSAIGNAADQLVDDEQEKTALPEGRRGGGKSTQSRVEVLHTSLWIGRAKRQRERMMKQQ